jgi:hypothetical protein
MLRKRINKTDHFGINQPCRKADVIASQLLRSVRLPTVGQMGSLIVELPIERLGSDVPLILDRYPSLDDILAMSYRKCQSEQLIELYFRHKITFFSEYTQARRQKQSAIPTVDLCCIGVCHGLLTVAFVIPFKLSCAAINPRAMDDVASISLNSSRVIRGKNYSSDISW